MPSIPLLTEPLVGKLIVLRDYSEHDIPEILIAYQDDRELHLRMGEQHPPSGAELGLLAERQARFRSAGLGANLTVVERKTEQWRGQVNVHNVDWDHSRAELSVLIAPEARGRGFGREAVRLAGEWLLVSCGIERVQIVTEPDNEPMLRAARGAGFAFEGVLSGYLRYHGVREDSAILSLLPRDL